MSKDRLIVFDTTLRDGEQSPGFSMNTDEKIRWRASSRRWAPTSSRRAFRLHRTTTRTRWS